MIGETLGSYRVLRQIGAGGMGNVYLAQHQLIGRNAAIKVLQPQYCKDPEFVARFFNEARATTQIRHPGIVEVLDYGNHPSGAAYLVMELLEGETLASRLKREGRVPAWLMSTIVRQVAAALNAAHVARIVHRDLKPENVFLVPERGAMGGLRVKILDFGVAKVTESPTNPSFTRADSMLGTPHYMSPEQCRGAGGVDWRSDIYAVGCIMFEMLTGRKVFLAQGLGELLAMHQRQPPPTLSSIDPSTPPELDYLLARLLAKRPEERPQSFEEVVLTLENLAIAYGWDALWSRTTGSVPVIAVGRMQFPGNQSFGGQLPQHPSHMGPMPVRSGAGALPPGVVVPVGQSQGSAPTTLGSAAAEIGAGPRPRRTALWVSAAVLVLGLGGGGAYVFTRGRAPSTGDLPAAAQPTPTAENPAPPPAPLPTPAPVAAPAAAPPDAPPPIVAVPLPPASAPDAAVAAAAAQPTAAPASTTVDAGAAEAPKPRPRRPRKPAVEL